jgi:6,7-dimethyl-8-ribityllumazine synthase
MSGQGRPTALPKGKGLRIALVAAQWHEDLCNSLRANAVQAIADCGAELVADVRVPGSLELAVVAQNLAQKPRVHAVVALGVVIRGGTPHFDHVCATTSDSLAGAALRVGKPIANGVLTCDTLEQAIDRAGLPESGENKGYDAGIAAVATAVTLRSLR